MGRLIGKTALAGAVILPFIFGNATKGYTQANAPQELSQLAASSGSPEQNVQKKVPQELSDVVGYYEKVIDHGYYSSDAFKIITPIARSSKTSTSINVVLKNYKIGVERFNHSDYGMVFSDVASLCGDAGKVLGYVDDLGRDKGYFITSKGKYLFGHKEKLNLARAAVYRARVLKDQRN